MSRQDGAAASSDRQFAGILEAEVDAMPGQRMNAVRGVADQRQPRRHRLRHAHQPQREGNWRRQHAQLPEHAGTGISDPVAERITR